MSDTNKATCPCGSESEFENCCSLYLDGKEKPETAEQLLRARYTAFTRGNIDFIVNTHHSRTRKELDRNEISDWSKNSEWLGLKIVQAEAGQATDETGTLIFSATYRGQNKEKPEEHWEKSFFEKENGEWRFLDAQGVQVGTYRRPEPKVGRNDPCPCGSGKKYKKCCGASI